MRSIIRRFEIPTNHETELINITQSIANVVIESGVQEGVVYISSMHTTTGITVNEGFSDLEADIANLIQTLVPDKDLYRHGSFLPSDGQMAVNASAHLRGTLLGFQVYFPIEYGKIVKGTRQTIYYVELDGPQQRTYVVQVVGQ